MITESLEKAELMEDIEKSVHTRVDRVYRNKFETRINKVLRDINYAATEAMKAHGQD